jgi:hypothetical protein
VTALRLYKGAVQPPQNGWSVDEVRENLFEQTADPGVSPWSQSNSPTVVTGLVDPLGGTEAFSIEDDSATQYESAQQLCQTNYVQGEPWIVTIFVAKDAVPASTRFPVLRISTSGAATKTVDLNIDTSDGSYATKLTGSPLLSVDVLDMVDDPLYEDDWWRLKVVFWDEDVGNTLLNVIFFPAAGANSNKTTYVASAQGLVTYAFPMIARGESVGYPLVTTDSSKEERVRVEGPPGTWEASKVTVTNEAPYSNLFHDAARWEENQAAAAASTRYVRDNGIIVPLTQFDSDGVAAAGAVWLKGLTSQTLELSKIYVAEVYADANTSDWLAVSLVSLGSLSLIAYFDLANGAVGTLGADVTSADIQLTDDGFAYRCRFTFDSDAVDATGQWRIYAAEGDNDLTWSTDRSTAGIYLGGLQLHQGDPFSPYVDVSGATAVTKTFGGNVIYLNKGAVQPSKFPSDFRTRRRGGASVFDEMGELQQQIYARKQKKQLLQLAAIAAGAINQRR